jgi:hypothetical protein
MFPRARKLLGKERLAELGARMEELKGELKESMTGRTPAMR